MKHDIACWIPKATDTTFRMCNTYCFSTAIADWPAKESKYPSVAISRREEDSPPALGMTPDKANK